MPEETNKFLDPKVALHLCESIIETEAKLKNEPLKKKQRKDLLSRYSSLLNQVENEFKKPHQDGHIPEEAEILFKEPYISQFKLINAKITPKYYNPKNTIAILESIFRLQIRLTDKSLTDKEKFRLKEEYSSLLLKVEVEITKPLKPSFFITISGLEGLPPPLFHIAGLVEELKIRLTKEYLNEIKEEALMMLDVITLRREKFNELVEKIREQEEKMRDTKDKGVHVERHLRVELEYLYAYLIARRRTIKKKIESPPIDWKAKIHLQELLSESQDRLKQVEREIIILNRIIEQPDLLEDKTLIEEEIKFFRQERENLRKEYYYEHFKERKFESWFFKEFGRYTRVREALNLIAERTKEELLKASVSSRSCPTCGNKIYGRMSFCIVCGRKL